jgi:hypothetical protein
LSSLQSDNPYALQMFFGGTVSSFAEAEGDAGPLSSLVDSVMEYVATFDPN